MKKQFRILAATFITVAFISCSKGDVNIPETQQMPAEEQTAANRPGGPIVIDPLSVRLEGWFTFDNHLKDVTKQLPDGKQYPASRIGPSYTTNRKGIANSAVKLDGNHYISLANVPQQANTSLSVWIKRSLLNVDDEILTPNGRGPYVHQDDARFAGGIITSITGAQVKSGAINDLLWHHIVVTYDGTFAKLYIDGALVGTNNNPQTFIDDIVEYTIGLTSEYPDSYWKGAIDDLRFYSRALTATDVQKLFGQ